jgi:hypothetical protein
MRDNSFFRMVNIDKNGLNDVQPIVMDCLVLMKTDYFKKLQLVQIQNLPISDVRLAIDTKNQSAWIGTYKGLACFI